MKTTLKILLVLLVICLLIPFGVMAEEETVLPTYRELMNTPGLQGTVKTLGHEDANDGAGMTYTIQDSLPAGILGNISVPTADGKWAVPEGLKTAPENEPDAETVEDVMKRAQTFEDAGSQLIWDPDRYPPLYDLVVHNEYDAPYPLTCSSFVGQVMVGYDFEHTTYVQDENTVVGDYVDVGRPTHEFHWQAYKLARWLSTDLGQMDVWLHDVNDPHLQRGDILFFSQQNPEGAGTTGRYYGNIFHTGIYVGDGKIINAYSATTSGGVVTEVLDTWDWLNNKLSFVARPKYTKYQKPAIDDVTEGSKAITGTAQPGINVTVLLNDSGTTLTTTADSEGRFYVEVPGDVVLNKDNVISVYSVNNAQNKSETATTTVLAKQNTCPVPPELTFIRSDLGLNEAGVPVIGEWGDIKPEYPEQAKTIKVANGEIKLIPYIPTRHGLVNFPEVAEELGIKNIEEYTKEYILDEIARTKEIFGDDMDGVFLDEFTSGLGRWWRPTVPWYMELVAEIRAIYGEDFYIVGNPGDRISEEVYGMDVDTFITFEGKADKYLSTDVHPGFLADADSSRLWHIVYNITPENIDEVLAKADSMNIDHLWLSDGEIINGPRHDGMPAQSPYTNVPSDWVIDAMKEWQNRKEGRKIDPISFWNPDPLDYAQRNRFEKILEFGDRLGTVIMSHYEAHSWNVKERALMRYRLSWDGFEDNAANDPADYLFRIKIPDNVRLQNYSDVIWEDGVDGYYYAPAAIGSNIIYAEFNGAVMTEDPWTFELDIVDKGTKEPVCTRSATALTHDVAWIVHQSEANGDEEETPEDKNTGNAVSGGGTSGSGANTPQSGNVSPQPGNTSPKTGDASMTMLLFYTILSAISLFVILAAVVKKRKNIK